MQRVYKILREEYLARGSENSLITNGYGGYFSYLPNSNYTGWYILNPKMWRMQKIIESILPIESGKHTQIYNQFFSIRRLYEDGEDLILPYNNTLLYNAQKIDGKIKLTLDGREIYEPSEIGRNYQIETQGNYTIISFDKNNTDKHYIVIKGIKDVNIINNWYKKEYQEDKKRNSQFEYWVYDAIEFSANSYVVFAYGENLNQAKTRADVAFLNFDEIINSKNKEFIESIPNFDKVKQTDIKFASQCAFWSLNNLTNTFEFNHNQLPAIYAGLPWFFQIWSRDELITLGGIISTSNYEINLPIMKSINSNIDSQQHNLILTKEILSRHIKNINNQGKLENRFPKSNLGSIDAFGWLGKRITDFLTVLKSTERLFTFFTTDELNEWFNYLKQGLNTAKQKYGKQGLFANAFCETWMDTAYNDDGRFGYTIETQTLFLSIYDALIILAETIDSNELKSLIEEKKTFSKKIKQFFTAEKFEEILLDRIYPSELNLKKDLIHSAEKISDISLNDFTKDTTIRPNIFLAAYLAPELFKKTEWEKIFDHTLENLYLPWGGLSTIDKNSGLFQPMATGHNNKSYHRGDSWYFINNIAAIVLQNTNSNKYKSQINKILKASTIDILEQGFVGHASEISSAIMQESSGTGAQAWSAATYLELVEFLNKK